MDTCTMCKQKYQTPQFPLSLPCDSVSNGHITIIIKFTFQFTLLILVYVTDCYCKTQPNMDVDTHLDVM